MAKDDTSPGGLFSKMVKFVRSPGTQWNDLDDPTSAKDGSLSKQALKEMIERKRRNDFVRKREFDMLRKLRRREATGAASTDGGARPSFFQSSMPSRPDDRAMTLKKIDEIEAQMSMQWWKTKHGTAGGASSVGPSSDFTASDMPSRPPAPSVAAKSAAVANSLAYARTAPDDLQNGLAQSAAKFSTDVEMLSGSRASPATAAAAKKPVVSASPAPSSGIPASPPVSGAASPIKFPDIPTLKRAGSSAPVGEMPAAQALPPLAYVPATEKQSNPANEKDDLSLDFTAELTSASKPLIKPSPFAASKASESAQASPRVSPASTPIAASPASAQRTPPQAISPASASAPKPPPISSAKNPVMLGGLAASYDASGAASGFSASKMFALEVDDVQHDPELEEASIRFANGDDAGAEAGLLEAVGARGSRHQHEETWMTLFDLYRATSQYDRFESLAIDFASKFGRSSPMWFSIPEMVSKIAGAEPEQQPVANRKADWKSPAVFGIQTLAAMNAAMSKAPMPWTLDWASIQSIDDNVVAALTKQFATWTAQPVQLRVAHAQKFEDVLRQGTPSGVRTVHQDRWNLLMAYLRMAHRPDEFELAALDFCVTYEVSPPSWESSRCEFKLLDADGNTGMGQTIIGDAVHDSIVSEMQTDIGGASSYMTAQLTSVELSGQIMGEPKPVLDKLEARLTGADVMIISCAKLIRVDFSAAGSLLNWVTARQAEGRIVQFTDVHRLVAAFFHVIGISEHAKVTTRVD